MTEQKSHPLVVDLDGTLIRSDLLIESFLLLIKQNPFNLFFVLLWLLKGKATLKTASGGTLTAMANGPSNISITDDKGASANISVYDVIQSNGVIHSIDKVLLPN